MCACGALALYASRSQRSRGCVSVLRRRCAMVCASVQGDRTSVRRKRHHQATDDHGARVYATVRRPPTVTARRVVCRPLVPAAPTVRAVAVGGATTTHTETDVAGPDGDASVDSGRVGRLCVSLATGEADPRDGMEETDAPHDKDAFHNPAAYGDTLVTEATTTAAVADTAPDSVTALGITAAHANEDLATTDKMPLGTGAPKSIAPVFDCNTHAVTQPRAPSPGTPLTMPTKSHAGGDVATPTRTPSRSSLKKKSVPPANDTADAERTQASTLNRTASNRSDKSVRFSMLASYHSTEEGVTSGPLPQPLPAQSSAGLPIKSAGAIQTATWL
eukprot:m.1234135 g.1234135  ORF g.1234135 m.1234135 type:complete len:332 (-) comp24664_c0_seq10:3040-4035(-)